MLEGLQVGLLRLFGRGVRVGCEGGGRRGLRGLRGVFGLLSVCSGVKVVRLVANVLLLRPLLVALLRCRLLSLLRLQLYWSRRLWRPGLLPLLLLLLLLCLHSRRSLLGPGLRRKYIRVGVAVMIAAASRLIARLLAALCVCLERSWRGQQSDFEGVRREC